jgi:hypothetical protein
MRYLCIAIAAPAVLIAAGSAFGPAGAAGVAPPLPGYEPWPHPYAAPPGYRQHRAYGQPPRYALPSYAYGLPPRYGAPPQYGPPPSYAPPPYAFTPSPGYGLRPEYGPAPPGYAPPPYAYGSLLPGHGSNPEYGVPPRTYDLPQAMPYDPNARFRAWNEVADSLTEALLQVERESSRDHSRFTAQSAHATRPR